MTTSETSRDDDADSVVGGSNKCDIEDGEDDIDDVDKKCEAEDLCPFPTA